MQRQDNPWQHPQHAVHIHCATSLSPLTACVASTSWHKQWQPKSRSCFRSHSCSLSFQLRLSMRSRLCLTYLRTVWFWPRRCMLEYTFGSMIFLIISNKSQRLIHVCIYHGGKTSSHLFFYWSGGCHMSYLNIEVLFTSPSIVHTPLLILLFRLPLARDSKSFGTFGLVDHGLLFLPSSVRYNLM